MLKNLLKFYAQQAGPAWFRIVFFCVISGLSSGLVLTTINSAIQARFDNAFVIGTRLSICSSVVCFSAKHALCDEAWCNPEQ